MTTHYSDGELAASMEPYRIIYPLLLTIPVCLLGNLALMSVLAPIGEEYSFLSISNFYYGFLSNVCHQSPTRCLWILNRPIGSSIGDGVRGRLRGLGLRQVLHVTLMEDDGTSWAAAIEVDSAWSERALALSAFTVGRGVLLPQAFPGEWNYWVGPTEGRGGTGDRPRLDLVERLQLSLRREEGAPRPEGRYGVEVEWVLLTIGGSARRGSPGP